MSKPNSGASLERNTPPLNGTYKITCSKATDLVGLLDRHLKHVVDTEKFRKLANHPRSRSRDAELAVLPRVAKRLREDEIAALASYYRSGVAVADIAKQYGIHRATVTAIVERNQIGLRTRGLSEAQVLQAIAEYQSGDSLRTLGERYGVHPSTINHTLQRHGVSLRKRNGWRYE